MISDVFVNCFYYFYKQVRLYGLVSLFCVLLLGAFIWSWLRPGLNLNSFSLFCALSIHQRHCWLGPFLNKNSHTEGLGDTTYKFGLQIHEGLWFKTPEVFSPTPLNTKVTQTFFLPSLLLESVLTLILGVWWCLDPKFMQGLHQIPCSVAPAFSLDSLTQQQSQRVLMVSKTHRLEEELPGCFLASQGPLPTLILGLCSSPWVLYHPLYGAAHEGGKKGNTPRTSSPAEYGGIRRRNNIHTVHISVLESLKNDPKYLVSLVIGFEANRKLHKNYNPTSKITLEHMICWYYCIPIYLVFCCLILSLYFWFVSVSICSFGCAVLLQHTGSLLATCRQQLHVGSSSAAKRWNPRTPCIRAQSFSPWTTREFLQFAQTWCCINFGRKYFRGIPSDRMSSPAVVVRQMMVLLASTGNAETEVPADSAEFQEFPQCNLKCKGPLSPRERV